MSTDEPTPTDYEAASAITSSVYRQATMTVLSAGAATPAQIAAATDHGISHISRALSDLRERTLVELVVPEETKKGRLYALTDEGETAMAAISELAVTTLDPSTADAPGIYLRTASGETVPLATAAGDGDPQRLQDALAAYDATASQEDGEEASQA
jgi:DNA-binding MarR family transcriptional regulator